MVIQIYPCNAEKTNLNSYPSAPEGDAFFSFQIESLSRKIQAEKFAEKLMRKGYPVYVYELKTRAGNFLYKVRIGHYKTRLEAETAALDFKAREKRPYLIVKSNLPVPAEMPFTTTISEFPLTDNASIIEEVKIKSHTATSRAEEKEKYDSNKPETEIVTKIFAYRDANSSLNITNNINNIPINLINKIDYITIFPVNFISPAREGTLLLFNVENKKKNLKISGIDFPYKVFPEFALRYFEQNLRGIPLRLKYSPSLINEDGTILARIYLKDGTDINLDMIRCGIGKCNLETIDQGQKESFKNAEDTAKRGKKGMWSHTINSN
jgi:hypothetical protein